MPPRSIGILGATHCAKTASLPSAWWRGAVKCRSPLAGVRSAALEGGPAATHHRDAVVTTAFLSAEPVHIDCGTEAAEPHIRSPHSQLDQNSSCSRSWGAEGRNQFLSRHLTARTL